MNVALRRPMTQEQFLLWVAGQEGRYEFDGVRPVAMVGGPNRLLPEPVVVSEVLSPSSRQLDLVKTVAEYRQVPTIRRYVMVMQDRVEVRGYARAEDGAWLAMAPLGAGDTLELPEIGIALPLAEIYEDVG